MLKTSTLACPMLVFNLYFYLFLFHFIPYFLFYFWQACKKGAPPKMGRWGSLPMNGQLSCEGPMGKTSLFDPPPGI